VILALEKSDEEVFEKKKENGRKRECKVCGNLFVPKWGFQIYCSDTCRVHAKSIQIREYMRRRRLEKMGNDAIKFLEELAQKQQFIEDKVTIRNGKCEACGSTKSLVEHHIKYIPEEKIILCKKCHAFLHNNLLQRKRCRPRTV
jgi:hypothetical protein